MSATDAPVRVGATYRATKNADGTFTVHDVPIMGTLEAGERGNKKAIDRDWLAGALAQAKADEARGYLPPLHFCHGTGTFKIGSFRVTRVGAIEYGADGERMDVLFADLLEVPEHVISGISAGDYPFRSVEVADWNEPCVNALGLLSGDAPHFRFARMIGVRVDETETPIGGPVQMRAGRALAAAFAKKSRHLAAVFDFRDAKEAEEPAASDGEDEDVEVDESGEEDEGEEEASDIAAAIAAQTKLLARILQIVSGEKDPDERQPAKDLDPEGEKDEGAEGAKKEKANMTAPNTNLDAASAARLAALETENTSLKTTVATLTAKGDQLAAKVDAMEREKKVRGLIETGRARLRQRSVVVPADFDAKCEKFAAGGDAFLEDYVATLEASGRTDPPATFDAAIGSAGGQDDAIVAALAAKGPNVLDSGRRAQAEWRTYRTTNPSSETTLRDWLKARGLPVA